MRISLIVPVFNEEDAVPLFYREVRSNKALEDYEIDILFIDDGSKDGTLREIVKIEEHDPLVSHVSLTRNFGKEAALFAGLEHATGDAIIPIDVDLQDPIEVIPQLVEKWKEGASIVLAKRIDRTSDGAAKRKTAEWFYKLHNKISSQKIEENVGDFRLLSKEVVEHITTLKERNLFMKGILSWVGGKTEIVHYTRAKRIAGDSKFNGWKLWNLALEGVTSFSTVPLRIWTYAGLFVAAIAFLYALWLIMSKLLWGNSVSGYSSIMTSILFIGGIQLIGIGVLGEYIGRIYIEVKRRPRYIVKNNDSLHNQKIKIK